MTDQSDDSSSKSSVGISLDELPTEDPLKAEEEAIKQRVAAVKSKKQFEIEQQQDVRIKNLSNLDPEEKLKEMSKIYEFDKKVPRYELIALYLIPTIIKHTGLYTKLIEYFLAQSRAETPYMVNFNFLLEIGAGLLQNFSFVFTYAELVFFFLVLVKFPIRSTVLRIVISFDGLELPIKLRFKTTDIEQRKKIKWSQIHSVKLNTDFITAIELFNDKKESLGMLRWDLWSWDKRSLEKILTKYISDKHPLKKFIIQNG